MKLTKGKLKQLEQDHLEYNRFLKQRHMPKITLEEYIDKVFGRVKAVKKKVETYKPTTNVIYSDRKQYPSVIGTGLAICAKKEVRAYSGEQKLLGIATLHKSNMVPVFARQDAEDIAKMRRN
jgi:hypothetical protein